MRNEDLIIKKLCDHISSKSFYELNDFEKNIAFDLEQAGHITKKEIKPVEMVFSD